MSRQNGFEGQGGRFERYGRRNEGRNREPLQKLWQERANGKCQIVERSCPYLESNTYQNQGDSWTGEKERYSTMERYQHDFNDMREWNGKPRDSDWGNELARRELRPGEWLCFHWGEKFVDGSERNERTYFQSEDGSGGKQWSHDPNRQFGRSEQEGMCIVHYREEWRYFGGGENCGNGKRCGRNKDEDRWNGGGQWSYGNPRRNEECNIYEAGIPNNQRFRRRNFEPGRKFRNGNCREYQSRVVRNSDRTEQNQQFQNQSVDTRSHLKDKNGVTRQAKDEYEEKWQRRTRSVESDAYDKRRERGINGGWRRVEIPEDASTNRQQLKGNAGRNGVKMRNGKEVVNKRIEDIGNESTNRQLLEGDGVEIGGKNGIVDKDEIPYRGRCRKKEENFEKYFSFAERSSSSKIGLDGGRVEGYGKRSVAVFFTDRLEERMKQLIEEALKLKDEKKSEIDAPNVEIEKIKTKSVEKVEIRKAEEGKENIATETKESREDHKKLMCKWGLRVTNCFRSCHEMKMKFLVEYEKWCSARETTLQILEELSLKILKDKRFSEFFSETCKIVSSAGKVAQFGTPILQGIGIAVVAIAEILGSLITSKKVMKSISSNSVELHEKVRKMEQDINLLSEVRRYGLQCDKKFKETGELLKQFLETLAKMDIHKSVTYDLEFRGFLIDLTEVDGGHQRFSRMAEAFRKFQIRKEILPRRSAELYDAFCGSIASDPSILETMEQMNCIFSSEIFASVTSDAALEDGWKILIDLMFDSNDTSQRETGVEIRRTARLLTQQKLSFDRLVTELKGKVFSQGKSGKD